MDFKQHKNLKIMCETPFANLPHWFRAARTLNAEIAFKYKKFIWHNGIWLDGTWEIGRWINGTWYNGKWKHGWWHNGIWHNGLWKNGFWDDGAWLNGDWKDGKWKGGIFIQGTHCKKKFYGIDVDGKMILQKLDQT
jgi:hypothetical protein